MEEQIKINPIKLSDVEKMIQSVKANVGDADVDLSFEFMLTAFFPTCWYNIEAALNKQYTLGYIAGVKDTERKNQGEISEDADCFCE